MKRKFYLPVILSGIIFMALTFLVGCGNTSVSPTEIEPNNTMSEAQKISVDGTEITGAINPGDDPDFYKFNGCIGHGYRVDVTWLSGETLDLKVYFYAYDGLNFYILNKTGAKQNETDTIDFHTSGGDCYVAIVDATRTNTGQYKISIIEGGYGTPNVAPQYMIKE